MSISIDQKQRNVKVVCRFRPLNDRQKSLSNATVHQLLDDKTVMIHDSNKTDKSNPDNAKFSFDRVFDQNSTQKQVYNYAAASVIDSVIQGFNGTIFAYGQTASGKTHTMEGQITHEITEDSGIIPRMVRQVFQSINKSSQNVQFRIKVSIVQLYMEKLRDLMDSFKNDLKIRSEKKKGIYIENLTEIYISTPEQVYQLMELARKTRSIASTNMNERSSRSHMLFILTISQNNVDDLSAKTGKLYLVDLAGSQKVGKTGAEGKVLDQAKKINVSLTALGKVINALTDGKSTHVPYRDSKLSRVLQQSLGGNSKTSLIVTCSPHVNNISQTISSLRFGVSAKKIKNKPKINKQMTVAQLQNMLQKTEKQLDERTRYIDQLKNYIVVDLKQKNVPLYSNESKLVNIQQQQTDLIGQLERQLQIQRNLNLVQEQQLNNFKDKYQKLLTEKQAQEKQLQSLIQSEKQRNRSLNSLSPHVNPGKSLQSSPTGAQFKNPARQQGGSALDPSSVRSIQQFLQQLQGMTSDPELMKYFREKLPGVVTATSSTMTPQSYEQLQTNLLEEQDKRVEAEEKFQKYEKTMQKKLNQLQNNICQLTHAYYDLLIIQQRHKVDNIFLKKKIEEKQMVSKTLRDKIRDLEDINRELQERGYINNDDRQKQSYRDPNGSNKDIDSDKRYSKYLPTAEQQDKLNQLLGDRKLPYQATHQNPKVVKVVRGGNK